ncbi:hypothetical protein MTR67_039030 [Solanum verrucosum]|uniref:Uncharacterized protein n=1 Tax=Solanum verrucosum TaxID=315347 RepID=A0AAF0UH45_SOLVR|nr:hypothetical protein MTR67_039030 [Solanum verrucosum]
MFLGSNHSSTTPRDQPKGPQGGPQPWPSKLPRQLAKMLIEGACPRRGLAPPWTKCLVRVMDVSQTLLSQNLISRNLWCLIVGDGVGRFSYIAQRDPSSGKGITGIPYQAPLSMITWVWYGQVVWAASPCLTLVEVCMVSALCVTLRWCLSLCDGMGHCPYIAQRYCLRVTEGGGPR